ncbi:MAG: hypothetical protein PUI64_00770 [Treponema succinifaciens]|uniref:hypothetical protein n=1 Tax=Treponema TaxID=157 RepID=UPI0023557818|nr:MULTISPECIES: hypothetical protein [Treponema]MCI6912038.1 hypothetical protein [Treponema succinifaciens]MDD6961422.1 hypothetical protein [Treponema succinifaciens]MDY5116739.1 hypothetical protein [Treponema succinifaciens]
MITKNFSVSKLKENAKSNQLRKEKPKYFSAETKSRLQNSSTLTAYKCHGKRIIIVFSIKLASRHGFLVQNRAIMRYTLIVAK